MNFKRIIPKSSSRSSSSSQKSARRREEISKLHCEIENLKQTVDTLKISLETRDAAIGTIAREKEKIYVELKGIQRTNRNLHQQLVDERDIHSKEKEYLLQEIKRLSNKDNLESCSNNNLQELQSIHLEELRVKDEVIYNICKKYLKIKESKQLLQKKYEKLKEQNLTFCGKIMSLLQENKDTMSILLNRLLKYSTIPPSSQKYLKLLKANADLHYENIQLKIKYSSGQDMILERERKSDKKSNQTSKNINVTLKGTRNLSKSEGILKSHTELNSSKGRAAAQWLDNNMQFATMLHKSNSRTLVRSVSDSCLT